MDIPVYLIMINGDPAIGQGDLGDFKAAQTKARELAVQFPGNDVTTYKRVLTSRDDTQCRT